MIGKYTSRMCVAPVLGINGTKTRACKKIMLVRPDVRARFVYG
jgi:hypothetical protein